METDILAFSRQLEYLRKRVADLSENMVALDADRAPKIEEVIADLVQALEELQVAEEELNTQVEELEKVHLKAEEERQRYLDLFQFSPDGYLVTDNQGVIREANQVAAALLGVQPTYLDGKPLAVFITPVDRRGFRTHLLQQKPAQFEARLNRRGAKVAEMLAAFTVAPIRDPHKGWVVGLRWIVQDITYARQMEDALRESEERFRRITQDAPLGVILLDEEGAILQANPAAVEMLGCEKEEARDTILSEYIAEDQRPVFLRMLKGLREGPRMTTQIETKLCVEKECNCWTRLALSGYHERQTGPRFAIAMLEDISEARQMSAEIRELQRRLIDGVEFERSKLARELHDGPIQDLYGAIFRLNGMADAPRTSPEVNETVTTLHQVIASLRSLCGELKPPTLAPFGLYRAILAYTDHFTSEKPDLQFTFEMDDDGQMVPERIRLGLFRIFQQAMTNALRHSGASQIQVSFHFDGENIRLEIQDNGSGFSVPSNWLELAREGHFGLASAAERAESLGGSLAVESAPDQGTAVRVTIPNESIPATS